jgi:hypothetical protein
MRAAEPIDHGGGTVPDQTFADSMSPEEHARIQAAIDANVAKLRESGVLPLTPTAAPVLFSWPLRPSKGLLDNDYHGIFNFVDLDPAFPGFLLDYNCGTRTYDTAAGYNHAGTDFFLTPFPWRKMSKGQVEIVAAAPGTITLKSDGNADQSCAMNGNQWNAVFVQHDDGSSAWYGHMKKLTLTAKAVGERVERGEYLGVVGSSGNSTGPHLHFEVYSSGGALIEPWAGPCNTLNSDSWWEAQLPYYDSKINDLTAGVAPPNFPACPSVESPNESTKFARGATITFTAYYHDQLAGQETTYTIRRPDGTVWAEWSHSASAAYTAWSYWFWTYSGVGSAGPDGLWSFEATYEGSTVYRPFNIGGSPAGRVPGDVARESPLSVSKGAGLVLAWSPSCAGDTDYEVYEGTLGNFTSHLPVMCTTGGAVTVTFVPGAGNKYYLVVPRTATREGSYGLVSAGAERPASTAACSPQELATCF